MLPRLGFNDRSRREISTPVHQFPFFCDEWRSVTLNTQLVLGNSGRIAARLDHYEERPEQLQMAEAVSQAIENERHLLVEAGTGVGKSFAYLVPALLSLRQESSPEEERRRIIVSTNTISLQEQLIHRDIPFLNAVLPIEFSAVLVKGRGNYISLRRLKGAIDRSRSLFSDDAEFRELEEILEWSKSTSDGSRSDIPFQPSPRVWDEVASEHGNCLGKKCPTYDACYYYRARRRIWNADLLVVNHALFFADLALRREGAKVLPDYDVVILDEAHTVESVAADHLGLGVSSGQIEYLLNKLYNDRTQRGLLTFFNLVAGQQLVSELRFVLNDFFYSLRDWQAECGPENGRLQTSPPFENNVSPMLNRLGNQIATFAAKVQEEEQRVELAAAAERCLALGQSLDSWLKMQIPEAVYWTEAAGRRKQNIKLCCAPIDVGPILRDELFNAVNTVILTSATLSVAEQDFSFIKQRLGMTDCDELKLGSPFDYRRQVRLILPATMPDPATRARDYDEAVCGKIQKYVRQTGGRAFVLFTSYQMMRFCADRLAGWFGSEKMTLFTQGDGLPRSLLLERFRKQERAVLFGTDSFWQGVDVPGDALSNVIIAKLPFSVPDHPLLEAKVEAIRNRGGNPFMEFQIPEAVIKLKQGFGRLIRSREDTGQVVILDPRIRTKPYGKVFLNSLPECELIIDE